MPLVDQVKFQGVAVLGGVLATGAAELVDVRVRFHVTVQHRLVHARIVALAALVRLGVVVIADVVFKVVLEFRYERTVNAFQLLLLLDMNRDVIPMFFLYKITRNYITKKN